MPGMTEGYRHVTVAHGASLSTHIGLVDDAGTELAGGSPAYARKFVYWSAPSSGVVRPYADAGLTENLVFDIPAAANVAGWRGYSAPSGGTDYGGKALTREEYAAQGKYTLIAALTAIKHQAGV